MPGKRKPIVNARTLLSSALCLSGLCLSGLCLSGLAHGQSIVEVGADGVGCSQAAAILSDGSAGAATVTFDYDAVQARLQVSVANTSPVVAGVPNPLITRVYFNVPTGTTTTATLVDQSSTGATQPHFVFGFDADAADGNDPNKADCLGTFNFRLASTGISDGIANPEADSICGEVKDAVLASTFVIQLDGPDVHGLASEVFAASTSRNALLRPVNVAVKFDGANCQGQGTTGNGDLCRTAVFLRGVPQLGGSIGVCVEGGNQCGSFLGVSLEPGPANFKKFTLPIGQPVLFTYDFGYFPQNGGEFCLPLQVPFVLELQGLKFYWTSLTHPFEQDGPYSFAPAFEFTIQGPQNPL
jgi:hypothetical protein